VTDPRRLAGATEPGPLPPPPFVIARPGGSKACNSYMPSGTGLDRLLWTMQVIATGGRSQARSFFRFWNQSALYKTAVFLFHSALLKHAHKTKSK
jgi:hypothetical protein